MHKGHKVYNVHTSNPTFYTTLCRQQAKLQCGNLLEQVYIIHLKKNSDCTKGVNVNWCRSSSSFYRNFSRCITAYNNTPLYQYWDMNTYYIVLLHYWLRSFRLDVNTILQLIFSNKTHNSKKQYHHNNEYQMMQFIR